MTKSVDYLRVSVTDRCNLRCVYCNPLGGSDFLDRKEILSFEEICRIVELFVRCGIRKVRLTGGEPLIRRNIAYLVRQLGGLGGIEDVAITTNGVLLEQTAEELKAGGLRRVNISIDSVERENYRVITGFDFLEKVMRGIYKAIEVGLRPVKVNAVILRGLNRREITGLAEISERLPVAVRFVEYCTMNGFAKAEDEYVSSSEVRGIIEERFGALSRAEEIVGNGPAKYFKIKGSAGSIGFISGRSSVFCRSCNRLRLTSDGKIRPCLYSGCQYDVKELLRNGASDEEILSLLEKIIGEKSGYTKLNCYTEEFCMREVGG